MWGRRDHSVLSLADCLLETPLGWNDTVKPALTGGEEGHPGDIRPRGRIPDPLARGLSIRQRLLRDVWMQTSSGPGLVPFLVFFQNCFSRGRGVSHHILLTPLTALSLPATSILDD